MKNTSDEKVKEFAERVLKQHKGSVKTASGHAKRLKVAVDTDGDKDSKEMLDKLSKLKGSDLDVAFLEWLGHIHHDTTVFDNEVKNGSDAELKTYAKELNHRRQRTFERGARAPGQVEEIRVPFVSEGRLTCSEAAHASRPRREVLYAGDGGAPSLISHGRHGFSCTSILPVSPFASHRVRSRSRKNVSFRRCRFEHVIKDQLAPETIRIDREYWLGAPGAFADIRVCPPGEHPYFVEVKFGYTREMLVRHLARKYRMVTSARMARRRSSSSSIEPPIRIGIGCSVRS